MHAGGPPAPSRRRVSADLTEEFAPFRRPEGADRRAEPYAPAATPALAPYPTLHDVLSVRALHTNPHTHYG
jgi:hypothetical protein